MPSFAIESALYKLRKKNGLRADERDFPENYVNGNLSSISIPSAGVSITTIHNDGKKSKKIHKLKDKIAELESKISDLNIKLNEKPKVIIIDKNTSLDELIKIKKECSES